MNKFDFRIVAILAVPALNDNTNYYVMTSDGGMTMFAQGFDALPIMIKNWIYTHNKPEYISSWQMGARYMHLMSDKEVA